MSKKHTKKLCISCKTILPNDIVEIGEQYPSAIYISKKIKEPKNFKPSSLNLTRCLNPKCNLIQLSKIYNLQ